MEDIGEWREKKKDKFKKKEYSGEGKQISKVRSLLVIKIILEYFLLFYLWFLIGKMESLFFYFLEKFILLL